MTTLKLILKAIGYTIAILVGALIFAMINWAAGQNRDLGTYAFWGGVFLGILAVLTDELKKREALVKQHAHERCAVAAPSHTPVLTEYTPGTHQVSTATIVDLHVGGPYRRRTFQVRTEPSTRSPIHLSTRSHRTERKHTS